MMYLHKHMKKKLQNLHDNIKNKKPQRADFRHLVYIGH